MLDIKINKRRAVRFNKTPPLKNQEIGKQLYEELTQLFQNPSLAKDRHFLEKIATIVKELHPLVHSHSPDAKSRQIAHFLSTPLGARLKTTLLQAALSYGRQNPSASELSEQLFSMVNFGPKFFLQLLRMFH